MSVGRLDVAELREMLQAAVLHMLPSHHSHVDLQRFYRLLRDYPERGGKCLRGIFVLGSCVAHGGELAGAVVPAAALELFQNWVLVHDDIEDDSEERRGQPALHQSVGVPIALNVGDAMHVYMWAALLALRETPDFHADAIRQEFLRIIHRTAEGQHLDLTWVAEGRFAVQEADYLQMVTLKTSWYTVIGPLNLGAQAAGVAPQPGFEIAGARLGAAFQIRDDVLNLDPSKSTGKEFAGDLYEGKRTLILAHLFHEATTAEREEAEAVLRKPRTAKTAPEIARLLKLIARYGSRDYAQSVAEREADAALRGLRAALATLPEQSASDALMHHFANLAQRQH